VTWLRKIAAIKALAMDDRGEPNTRAIARAKLEQFQRDFPEVAAPQANPANPRTQPSQEYVKFKFMDLNNWRISEQGNHSITVSLNGRIYRVTLVLYKKSLLWDWMYRDKDGVPHFGETRFATCRETQEDAWNAILYSMRR
jgi:hypothetical protein